MNDNVLKAPFIIADVGSNWRMYDDTTLNKRSALQHIRDAAKCGVQAVKFQLFTHDELYGSPGDNTYSLPREWFPELAAECQKQGVEFMCTAFSAEGVRFVDPYVKRHKIASAEMMHGGILNAVIATGKPFLVSMGGQSVHDVNLVFNYIHEAGRTAGLLECVAAYPAVPGDYNLAALQDWSRDPSVELLGVSDHTLGCEVALVSISLGATVFEKHFKSWGNSLEMGTPDWAHSLNPGAMESYVSSIRTGFSALGDGIKRPRESEAHFVKYARREAGMDTFRRKA